MKLISIPAKIKYILLFLFPILLTAQVDNFCTKSQKIIKIVQEYHFDACEIDEKYALQVSELLVENLDPSENIFSLAEVEKIKTLSPIIAKDLGESTCEFLPQIVKIFSERLELKETLLSQMSDYQWKKNVGEGSISLTNEKKFVSSAEFESKLKFRLNAELIGDYLMEQEENAAFDATAFQEKGQGLVQRERCQIERLRTIAEAADKYVGNAYLRAIASGFDPHTNFFSEDDKRAFMDQMAQESSSFGLETELNAAGEIEITGLIPGSSAWNSNQLNEGDVLLSVKTKRGGSKEFSCAETEEAIELISSMLLFDAIFTVRKKSGKTIEVELSKGSQISTEDIVQSFILEGEKKIGYIYLPTFYSTEVDGKGCGDAVAKQLIKLKREGIEALIFDVRDNGGGAFDEALKIAGMFIDYGAVSMTDVRDQDPKIFKDPARGKLFSAPLIVLQNRLSGSASELFAATMQDYNRALIVGSPSFGKSTMQQIFPLSTWKRGRVRVTIGSSGYVKTTIGKFYRVTGKSHQQEGVQPDVFLPESVVYGQFGENTYPNAIAKDELEKDSYYKPMTEITKETIIANSKKRVAESAAFQKLIKENGILKNMEAKPFVISTESLQAFVEIMQTAGEHKDEKEGPFKAEIPTYLQNFAQGTKVVSKTSKLEDLESNIHVREAYQIGLELLSQ